MQSSINGASRIVAWEQVDLPNQVYALRNVRLLDAPVDVSDWVDCSDNAQWLFELTDCLADLGVLFVGEWVGMGKTIDGVCHGLAWERPA